MPSLNHTRTMVVLASEKERPPRPRPVIVQARVGGETLPASALRLWREML
jgi:hypothetical protein